MRYRRLGNTGTLVSEFCLGSMTFGGQTDARGAAQIVGVFLDEGGNFFDTADSYNGGESERMLGKLLRDRRDDVILATKTGLRVADGPNDIGGSAQRIIRGVERSLRRLDTDYVDLFQLHTWDPVTPVEETLSAVDVMRRQGKIRYFGVSNVAGWQLTVIRCLAGDVHGLAPVTVQQQYSLVDRTIERELVPASAHLSVGLLPWGPLGGGFLSGKYSATRLPPSGTRLDGSLPWMEEHWERRATPKGWAVLETLAKVSSDVSRSHAQVALNWLLRRPQVVSPLIGARTAEQVRDNLGAADWDLDAAQMDALNEASALEPEYTERFLRVAMEHRVDYDPEIHPRVGLR